MNKIKNPIRWQVIWLKNNYKNNTRNEIAEVLGVKKYTLDRWLKYLGLSKRNTHPIHLRHNHKQFIRKNYLNMSHKKMAAVLIVPVTSISKYCSINKLKKQGIWSCNRKHLKWKGRKKISPTHADFIRNNYKLISHKEISEKINVSVGSIRRFCSKNK